MMNSKFFQFAKLVQRKIYSLLFFVSFAQLIQAQNPHPEHGLGAQFLTQAQYDALPNANWAEIKSYSTVVPTPEGTYGANGVTMLNNPPIGDQQTQGSCVGWAAGYTAMSILTYPKFHCWDNAKRSPNYVYNQIKVTSDCGSGSYPLDAVNLLKNQGDCSWNLMPYNNADCATQPNTIQRNDAAQNKAVNYGKLAKNDFTGIKLALDLGFPVIVGQRITTAFYDMWYTNGIWSSNYGQDWGGHATCIIGYDDRRQQFKVQNQWGTAGGDNGYYWVTYNMVQNNCFAEVYILYGNNGVTTLDITGYSILCQGVTSATYTVGNLPCNTTIAWTTNVPQVTVSPATGTPATLSTNGYTGTVTLTATITNSSGSTQIIKPITIQSSAPQIGGSYTNAFDGSNNPLGFYPYVTNPACTGYYITTNIQPGGTATWQKISSSDVVLWNQNGNNISFYLSTPNQNAVFQLTYVMPCGTDVKQFKWQSSNCGIGPGGCNTFSVSPNPSNGKVIVIVPNKPAPCNFSKTTSSLDNKNLNIAAINVYNISGNIVRQIKTGITKQASVDLSGLTNGSYYLETISTDGYREKQLVILQK